MTGGYTSLPLVMGSTSILYQHVESRMQTAYTSVSDVLERIVAMKGKELGLSGCFGVLRYEHAMRVITIKVFRGVSGLVNEHRIDTPAAITIHASSLMNPRARNFSVFVYTRIETVSCPTTHGATGAE